VHEKIAIILQLLTQNYTRGINNKKLKTPASEKQKNLQRFHKLCMTYKCRFFTTCRDGKQGAIILFTV